MKIGVATKNFESVAGHAGKAQNWLIYDLAQIKQGDPLPQPSCVKLAKEQLFHHFQDDGEHPLDGLEIVIAGSAGDGFIRHMKKRGAEVVLTGETDPAVALARIIGGEAQPDQRFDITTSLCKLRDLFSRH